jgi:diguanylate cyclase (GGDEF)-like protein
VLRWDRLPGRQPDQFDWISVYLHDRGLQRLWRITIVIATVALAASTALMVRSSSGPNSRVTATVCLVAAGLATAAALPFAVRWPTRRQSLVFSIISTATIAAACLSFSSPYAGLMGCATFAVTGGFVAYFHTLTEVLINGAVALVCATVLAARLIAATGDVYLTAAALAVVITVNVTLPFGIQSVVHTMRTDLRSSGRDPLTGLHNRRSFQHSAYELIMRHHNTGAFLVITVVDLDNFKQLNDTHGHAAGDTALIDVSAALEGSYRRSAVIGRSGGEEFVVAAVERNPGPWASAERLRQAIADTPAPVTASIGVASACLADGAPRPLLQLIDDLVGAADAAMYQAKRAGGNQVCHAREVTDGHPRSYDP